MSMYETIGQISDWIDQRLAVVYPGQPVAQDWSRVAKCGEEAGEAIAALIGRNGENPRKGVICTTEDVLAELADVAVAAIGAIQHFTGDAGVTQGIVEKKVEYIAARAGLR